MFNKKFTSFILAMILVFSLLTGCAKPAEVVVPLPEPALTPPTEVVTPEPVVVLDKDEVILEAVKGYLTTIPEKNNMMGAADAMQLFADNPGQVLLIDIRSKDDYNLGHIAGAMNIPFAELGKNLDRLPMNKQIILQCYSGQTSSEAVSLTRALGFNTINFNGGFNNGWKKLELSEDTLEMTENAVPDAVAVKLDEKQQIVWDAVAAFFTEGKAYIEKPADVNELLVSNPGALYVLDIRAKEDFDKGHIEGAENIGFKAVGDNLDKLPKNKPIYITCYSGQTAGQVLSLLRIAGYNVSSVSMGMGGWTGAELPVVTN